MLKLIPVCCVVIVLVCFSLFLSSCGGGGSGEQKPGDVNIASALSCSISMDSGGFGIVKIPANCEITRINGDNFETDQSIIHLSGSSFGPVSNNCSNPTIGGPPCIPIFPGSTVQWTNLSNGVSGFGSSGYHVLGFLDPDWFIVSTAAQGSAGWSTYSAGIDSAGIALEMGSNSIQVSVEDTEQRGTNEITVIRVTDVTPPFAYNVDPEPDGIYYFRVVVYFTEQLDPESITNALQVVDSNGQTAPGITVYDPLNLTLVWQPEPALSQGTVYNARLGDIADVAGNTMIGTYDWSFTVL